MTQEAACSSHGHHVQPLEAEILAALWEEVPFPRLPLDAPTELKDLVVKIENPKRVYTIHRATRRHDLQLLVEKFISQLRYGCGHSDCPTPSCFSCRRRLAGKAPMRRYSPTSARTLAIYLAGQDNPELHLCPNLQVPRGPSDGIKPLIFGPKQHPVKTELGDSRSSKKANGHARGLPLPLKERDTTRHGTESMPGKTASHTHSRGAGYEHDRHSHGKEGEPGPHFSSPSRPVPGTSISERPIRKDYRSFAANVFGTVAFKMVEWLTPSNIDAIAYKATDAPNPPGLFSLSASGSPAGEADDELPVPRASSPGHSDKMNTTGRLQTAIEQDGEANSDSRGPVERKSSSMNGTTNGHIRPSHSRKNSNARVRTSSVTKPQSKRSTDHIPDAYLADQISGPLSPRLLVSPSDKAPKSFVRTTSTRTRRLSNAQVLGKISDEEQPEEHLITQDPSHQHRQVDGESNEESSSVGDTLPSIDTPCGSSELSLEQGDPDSTSALDDLLPQSLSRLDSKAVDFLCDVLQEDLTTERHLLEPQAVQGSAKRARKSKALKRRAPRYPYSHNLKLEWKLFIEQSIFNVLSDPYAILESFTNQDGIISSQTLWHHMLRLTRVAPSLVFDSLWIASASLFAPPKVLQSAESPTATFFPQEASSLTNEEAGFVLSVCFHALVAAAPLITDSIQLLDMSRIRSHGLILAESGAVARQPPSLCLEYEEAFTDSLALRLARRLLAAIPTRKYFDELIARDADSEDGTADCDMLETLLSHLEPGRDTQSAAEFSHAERDVHEKRVPILLLDWARTVMISEWQGRPDVPGDGPFGGALSLIAAMYQKRKSLLLGDFIFRIEYFGDRLDAIELPVSWLAFNSTRQKAHLLDHPYIFHQSSLVSYFRAVNFSRMSRSYEESSSLQSRISAIIATDSLVTEQHHKGVLQDLLKIASAKFLILDIGRKTVIRDVFDQLWRRQERELMRPLKVHLGEDTGEEGFDSGGVQQEFFRLAIAEALNPDYGAFTVDDRTRMTWFQPGSLQPEWKFELIGLLMSLAVFNGLTLPITFPKALYRKLLGEPVTELHHIADGWPELASGLTTLIEWDEKDGAVEDIFARTYEFSIEMVGQPVSREMEPSQRTSWPQFSSLASAESLTSSNPEDAPLVTGDNRNAYVSDYIRYLTDVSVAQQYEAFARGFRTCLNIKSLSLLTSPLLQSIVEGTQEIDITELRHAVRYVGWDASHRSVRDFWSIVKRYDDGMKRKLLEFVTASDRVPVGGMRNIQFVVQKNGEQDGENGHLPTAYTCYGTLLLPEYRDKEVLRERLGMALENAQGFGFA